LLVVVVFVPNGSHCHGSAGSGLLEGFLGRSSVEKDVAGGDGDELVLSTEGLTRGQSRGCATGSERCGRFRIGNGAPGRGAGAMVCFLVLVDGGEAEFGLSVRGGAGIANGHVVGRFDTQVDSGRTVTIVGVQCIHCFICFSKCF